MHFCFFPQIEAFLLRSTEIPRWEHSIGRGYVPIGEAGAIVLKKGALLWICERIRLAVALIGCERPSGSAEGADRGARRAYGDRPPIGRSM